MYKDVRVQKDTMTRRAAQSAVRAAMDFQMVLYQNHGLMSKHDQNKGSSNICAIRLVFMSVLSIHPDSKHWSMRV